MEWIKDKILNSLLQYNSFDCSFYFNRYLYSGIYFAFNKYGVKDGVITLLVSLSP